MDAFKENAINVTNDINEGVDNFSNSIKDTIKTFGSPAELANAGSDFLNSNTMVAKIAIILLILTGFVVLLVIGINLIGYFTKNATNPYIVKGMISGGNSAIVPGNLITRSNNRHYGIEYTWSIWLQVNDVVSHAQQYAHIFNKGNGNYMNQNITVNGVNYPLGTGLATVNNGPGLYLANGNTPGNVDLYLIMDSVDPSIGPTTINVTSIPLNKKWMHVAIRLENTLLDIYVNGTITGRYSMTAVPKQNYGDVYVCQNSGFTGFLSNLQYYPRALSAFEINQIVGNGPNTSLSSLANSTKGAPYYLSVDWYFSKLT
jgi:Concanavalin A-like lectin/glucanases superfamily